MRRKRQTGNPKLFSVIMDRRWLASMQPQGLKPVRLGTLCTPHAWPTGKGNPIPEVCHRLSQRKTGRSQSLQNSRLNRLLNRQQPLAFNHQHILMRVSATINVMQHIRAITWHKCVIAPDGCDPHMNLGRIIRPKSGMANHSALLAVHHWLCNDNNCRAYRQPFGGKVYVALSDSQNVVQLA